MRAILAILLAALPAAAGDKITFQLPDLCGNPVRISDFEARYVLLVTQGIP